MGTPEYAMSLIEAAVNNGLGLKKGRSMKVLNYSACDCHRVAQRVLTSMDNAPCHCFADVLHRVDKTTLAALQTMQQVVGEVTWTSTPPSFGLEICSLLNA